MEEDATALEYRAIAGQYSEAKAQENAAAIAKTRSERQFKVFHGLLIGFLLWILYVLHRLDKDQCLFVQLSPCAGHLFFYEGVPSYEIGPRLQVRLRRVSN